MTRALPVVAILTVLAAGCATRGHVRRLEGELRALQTDDTALKQSQQQTGEQVARMAGELKELAARTHDLGEATRHVGTEMGRLSGRLDELEGTLRQTRASLESHLAAPPPAVPERPAPDVSAAHVQGAEAAYTAALATFRAREHGQAVLDFLDFIAKYPHHPLAANAQFWIAESYYAQHDYRQALVEFRKVSDYGLDTPKAADALLMVGFCYQNLRDGARARATWQRLLRQFPRSNAANRARSLLGRRQAARH